MVAPAVRAVDPEDEQPPRVQPLDIEYDTVPEKLFSDFAYHATVTIVPPQLLLITLVQHPLASCVQLVLYEVTQPVAVIVRALVFAPEVGQVHGAPQLPRAAIKRKVGLLVTHSWKAQFTTWLPADMNIKYW